MQIVILSKCINCGGYVDELVAEEASNDLIQWYLSRIARGVVEVQQKHVCSTYSSFKVMGALKPVGVKVYDDQKGCGVFS